MSDSTWIDEFLSWSEETIPIALVRDPFRNAEIATAPDWGVLRRKIGVSNPLEVVRVANQVVLDVSRFFGKSIALYDNSPSFQELLSFA